jgi:endogenous inhibitor of DNA gyrase (YacG/DUF329 family)
MTYRPQTVKCWVCKEPIEVSEVKYHTAMHEGSPAKPFCGPECSLKYYQEQNKDD